MAPPVPAPSRCAGSRPRSAPIMKQRPSASPTTTQDTPAAAGAIPATVQGKRGTASPPGSILIRGATPRNCGTSGESRDSCATTPGTSLTSTTKGSKSSLVLSQGELSDRIPALGSRELGDHSAPDGEIIVEVSQEHLGEPLFIARLRQVALVEHQKIGRARCRATRQI